MTYFKIQFVINVIKTFAFFDEIEKKKKSHTHINIIMILKGTRQIISMKMRCPSAVILISHSFHLSCAGLLILNQSQCKNTVDA